ncbi:MAG: hypothetical protein IJX12_03255 [Lachnospiraceae bacterium]|nr:hypothetical protein [Lachnospiraceae bacterium]
MELKIKDDNEEKKLSIKTMDLETGDIVENNGFSDLESEPIKISTTVDYKSSNKKFEIDVFSIIKWVVLLVIVVVGIKVINNIINPKITDLTPYINMETEDVASGLNSEFAPDEDMAAKIPHYSEGTVSVESNGDVGVVYIDGKYAGLHTDGKKYGMFGVKIGDSEYNADKNMTYESDECMSVLNDMADGNSTAYYYANFAEGDCFVIIVNGHSNKVVAMTYFKDYALVTETLESLE